MVEDRADSRASQNLGGFGFTHDTKNWFTASKILERLAWDLQVKFWIVKLDDDQDVSSIHLSHAGRMGHLRNQLNGPRNIQGVCKVHRLLSAFASAN